MEQTTEAEHKRILVGEDHPDFTVALHLLLEEALARVAVALADLAAGAR